MSILIDANTRVIVQGITGSAARADVDRCLRSGTKIVAGVSPGREGEAVHGVAVYDTVREALRHHQANASAIYVPAAAVRDAVLEALDAGIRLLLVTAEYVPIHDVLVITAAARKAAARLIGCNTNGIISPGKSRIGGIGGTDPDELYPPGFVGICSRSGGMSAEIALTLKAAGLGVSTCVSMGGDNVTGLTMGDYALLFEADPDTKAIVVFGEPGTSNELEACPVCVVGEGGQTRGRADRRDVPGAIPKGRQLRACRCNDFRARGKRLGKTIDACKGRRPRLRGVGRYSKRHLRCPCVASAKTQNCASINDT